MYLTTAMSLQMDNSVSYPIEYIKDISEYSFDSVSKIYTNTINIGTVSYHLTQTLELSSFVLPNMHWVCFNNRLNDYESEAETLPEAIEDFKLKIHVDFQRLLQKRPFERTLAEKEKWRLLSSIIDVPMYKKETPITTNNMGQISFGKTDHPYKIKWIDGTSYKIDIRQVPAELMALKTGQWIEVVAQRDPVTYSIKKIIHINRISYNIANKKEDHEFWTTIKRV